VNALPKAPRILERLGDLDALERCEPDAVRAWFTEHRKAGIGELRAWESLRAALEAQGRVAPDLERVRETLEEDR